LTGPSHRLGGGDRNLTGAVELVSELHQHPTLDAQTEAQAATHCQVSLDVVGHTHRGAACGHGSANSAGRASSSRA
jgi:hypothetical protein